MCASRAHLSPTQCQQLWDFLQEEMIQAEKLPYGSVDHQGLQPVPFRALVYFG
jgi:hypothetical protein